MLTKGMRCQGQKERLLLCMTITGIKVLALIPTRQPHVQGMSCVSEVDCLIGEECEPRKRGSWSECSWHSLQRKHFIFQECLLEKPAKRSNSEQREVVTELTQKFKRFILFFMKMILFLCMQMLLLNCPVAMMCLLLL